MLKTCPKSSLNVKKPNLPESGVAGTSSEHFLKCKKLITVKHACEKRAKRMCLHLQTEALSIIQIKEEQYSQ